MHDCPRCGQACTCSGDIDDTYVLTEEWVFVNCQCECEDEDFDYDDGLDEEFIRPTPWELDTKEVLIDG